MNLRQYGLVLALVSLFLTLLVASPTLSLVLSVPSGKVEFSDIWVLGPDHTMENYPFNVRVGETYRVFVGVGNHMGFASQYMIYVKFRNQTQSVPDTSNSLPSSLPPIYEYRIVIANEARWETTLALTILGVSFEGNSTFVKSISINDRVLPVNSSAAWNPKYDGFYYQIFFELWLYNVNSKTFQFNNRFVGFWLNMSMTS